MYKLMNLDGEFLSRLPAFFPLIIFCTDPDPQSCWIRIQFRSGSTTLIIFFSFYVDIKQINATALLRNGLLMLGEEKINNNCGNFWCAYLGIERVEKEGHPGIAHNLLGARRAPLGQIAQHAHQRQTNLGILIHLHQLDNLRHNASAKQALGTSTILRGGGGSYW